MKKTIFIIIVLNLSLTSFSFAQKKTNENAKYALNTFYIYNLVKHSLLSNVLPGEFILDNNKDIIGIKIFALSNFKYKTFKLVTSNDSIKSIVDNNNVSYDFIWENGKIIKIKNYDNEYKIKYNNDKLPVKIIKKGLVYGYYKIENEVSYLNNKPSKVIYFENNLAKNTKWYRKIIEFSYENNKVSSTENIYKTDLKNTPENIVKTENKSLKIVNDSTFILKLPWTEIISVYDKKDRIINRKDSMFRSKTVSDKYFFYSGTKLYKEVTFNYANNKLKEKQVGINYIIPEMIANAPKYEHEVGVYKFDANNNMIYESKKGKFRVKKNGKWSEWKHFIF